MLYLILAILSSTLVSVLMRIGSGQSETRKQLLAVNYLTCMGIALIFLRRSETPAEGLGIAAGFGLIGGILYLTSFLLLQKNVRENGISLSSAFMKLGVTVPTVLGFVLFGESPTLFKLSGIALTVLAILVLSGMQGGREQMKVLPLVSLMIAGGLADGLSKFYNAYGKPEQEGLFLFFIFGFAFLLCSGPCVLARQIPDRRELLFGFLLGIPNYFSSLFLLAALGTVPASTAYPLFSCGTIALTTMAGTLLFRERLERRHIAAMALIAAALVFLNI